MLKNFVYLGYMLVVFGSVAVKNCSLVLFITYDVALGLLVLCRNAYPPKRSIRPDLGAELRLAVVITERNEAQALPKCLDALDKQTHAPDSIHVIDDGSNDLSLQIVRERLPQVRVWSLHHSGKANSMNQVWPQIETDLIVTLDADTVLEPEAIFEIRQAFSRDSKLGVLAGGLRPQNEAPTLLGRFQELESIRAFLTRRAWALSDMLLVVPGAFATFRKTVFLKVGGFDSSCLVEDYEIIHRIQRCREFRVEMMQQVRASTDMPQNLRTFVRQRSRWFGGFLQTHFRSWDMVGDLRYGAVGRTMLILKTIDTLHPFFGILALLQILFILTVQGHLGAVTLGLLSVKLAFDLLFTGWCLHAYSVIHQKKITLKDFYQFLFLSGIDVVSFQVLKFFVAARGWVLLFKREHEWLPRRRPWPSL